MNGKDKQIWGWIKFQIHQRFPIQNECIPLQMEDGYDLSCFVSKNRPQNNNV